MKKQTIFVYRDIDDFDSLKFCIEGYINSEKWNRRCPKCGGTLEQGKCLLCGKKN